MLWEQFESQTLISKRRDSYVRRIVDEVGRLYVCGITLHVTVNNFAIQEDMMKNDIYSI